MLKNIKKIYIIILFLFIVFSPLMVLADDYGLDETAGQAFAGDSGLSESDLENEGVITSLPKAIGRFVGAGLAFIGVVFLVLMIYGGFTWMIARGNEQEVEKAKNIIEASVIGLVIVLSAYAITAYIGDVL